MSRFVKRHPGMAIFLIALLIRLLVAVTIGIVNGGTLFLDDQSYRRMALDKASDNTALWSDYEHSLYTKTATFLAPIVLLNQIFGSGVILAQLVPVFYGAIAAALTFLLARQLLPIHWAVVAGLGVALLPSQILWSSLVLKDSAVWAVLAGFGLTTALALRATGVRLAILAGSWVGLGYLMGHLRLQTLIIALWAVFATTLVGARKQWLPRVALALAVTILLPIYFEIGPGGKELVLNVGSLSERRYLNALGAKSAFVPDEPPPPILEEPISGAISPTSPPSETGGGQSNSKQQTTTPPPEQPILPKSDSKQSDVAYLPTGLVAVLLRPFPWEASESTAVSLARIETLIWYPLLILALIGVPWAMQRFRLLAFPILTAGGIWVVYGLTEGNLGTAFRHRAELEWIVVLLATIGAMQISGWWRIRARPHGVRIDAAPFRFR